MTYRYVPKPAGGIPACCCLRSSGGSVAIVVTYVIFGVCWILFSDLLLTRLLHTPEQIAAVSVIKGWLFIAITAFLLYLMIKRRMRMQAEQYALHAAELDERERRLQHANRLYAVLSVVNRCMVRIQDKDQLLKEICTALVTAGRFKMACIGWPDQDGWVLPQAVAGDTEGYLNQVHISARDIPEGQGPTGTALRTGLPVVCDNIADNPIMFPWRDLALKNGFAASASLPVHLPDGRLAALTVYSTEPDFFSETEKTLLLEVSDDITFALKMLYTAAAHRAAEQRLSEVTDCANRAKMRFLHIMSHELRTPLNIILGTLQIQEMDKVYHADLTEDAKTALFSMTEIIDNILEMSRLESAQFNLDRTPVDLRALATTVCKLFSFAAENKGLKLTMTIDESVPDHVAVDELRLQQILVHLINNAIKFTEQGEVGLCLGCEKMLDSGRIVVHIEVKDTGIGIEPEKLEAVFGSFIQADDSDTRLYGGIGLGLALTKRLVELMGGRITVESKPAKGTIFTVRLPLQSGSEVPENRHENSLA